MDSNFFLKTNNQTKAVAVREQNSLALALCSHRTARELLDFDIACKYKVLPLSINQNKDKKTIFLASCDDSSEKAKDLSFLLSSDIEFISVESEQILPAIYKAYKSDENNLYKAKAKLENSQQRIIKKENKVIYPVQANNPESIFLKNLIEYAIAQNASDIHLLARKNGSFLKLRVDGELFEHIEAVCNLEQHRVIVGRIKILAGLNTAENRRPQDGSFQFEIPGETLAIRVSIFPTLAGEKVVLRLQKYSVIKKLSELGLDNFALNAIKQSIQTLQGLILFCGPTGSGKTSSMYAIIEQLSHINCSIISIEDPVEIRHPLVDQTSINPSIGLDYEESLKSVLRQDPDVILLGEIRDINSAKIAIQAALSGHLILSTVHSANVFQAILRLQNLAVEPQLIAECLKLIVNQRLIPSLCPKCKRRDPKQSEHYTAVGCSSCQHSGYQGRILLSETLLINNQFRNKIAAGRFSVHNAKNSKSFYQSNKVKLATLLEEGKIDRNTFKKFYE